jgi:nicotinate-nucleotide adenylyltransferase
VNAVALLGGTFDPVHFGHLRAALEAQELLGSNDFRLLPAGTPPHRVAPSADASHRLAMLELAVARHPQLSVDDRETRRSGYSWMTDTLDEIRREEGDKPLILLIGQDAANGLDTWHRWERLFGLCHLVVMRRPDSGIAYSSVLRCEMEKREISTVDRLAREPAGSVLPLEITQLEISSTSIREILADGRSPGFLMPESVIDYIHRNRLYGA